MPYEIGWEQAPYLLYLNLIDKVSEEDVVSLISEATALMQSEAGGSNAHVLIDVSEMKSLPPINVLRRELDRLRDAIDTRDGVSIVFGLSAFARYIMELLLRVSKTRFKAFETRDEAEQFAWQMVEIRAQAQAIRESAEDDSAGESA
jgi:hypothetical protein